MSQKDSQQTNVQIKTIFQNPKLTGFDIAQNNDIPTIVRRDSTDFASEVVKHERGRQIIQELIDVVLRPRLLIMHLQNQKNSTNKQVQDGRMPNGKSQKINQPSKQTSIIYNAIQILTNQYENFVKFIFEGPILKSGQNIIGTDTIEQMELIQKKSHKLKKKSVDEYQEEDRVIMDGNYPELIRNEEDETIKRINSISKLNDSDFFQCDILQRMFLLFQQPVPIQQTPVSYFNKIMLQFVYQKPEQIMRFFYCQRKNSNKKVEPHSRIKKMARHLYNSSMIQLFIHIMQLENDGNFFSQEKIQILKAITEEVFYFEEKKEIEKFLQTGNEITEKIDYFTEEKINNYILFLKALYEKLEDRYEQEKFLQILKLHINDEQLLEKILTYFQSRFNYFEMPGFSTLLIQILKMDHINFRLHKTAVQAIGLNNFSFNTKNQESSVASYDLKLSKGILDQIQKILKILCNNYKLWQNNSTIRLIQYYELIHSWLNLTIKERQIFARQYILTPKFINECLFKIQAHQKSTLLHNSIKNILVEFLPKINDSLNILLAPQCQLINFLEIYLSKPVSKEKKTKKVCFLNQLYHICKAVLAVWEQQKILNVIKKTQEDDDIQEEDCLEKIITEEPSSPLSDQANVIRFQKLKAIMSLKQQFYDHLICGDPRKIGEYQEEESSEIIIVSSEKNFFKPSSFPANEGTKILSKDRYGQEEDDTKNKHKAKAEVEDLKKQTNLKTDPKYKNLKLGDDYANSLFDSAISPLNANRSHTFSFDIDLPLDSDYDIFPEVQELPLQNCESAENDEIMNLMQENIENFSIVAGNIVRPTSSILFLGKKNVNKKNNFFGDNCRLEQLSKSIDIQDLNVETIQRVDSYFAILSPRIPSEDDSQSLGLNSKSSISKSCSPTKPQKPQTLNQQIAISLIQSGAKQQSVQKEQSALCDAQILDSSYLKNFGQYLSYDLDQLCREIQ